MISIDDFISKTYILRDIKRYNNSFRIKDESVAEHCFFVALIVLRLHKTYDFNLTIALQMALVHDIAEIDVTDMPHNVKNRFPKLAKELENSEIEAQKEYWHSVVKLNKELLEEMTIESKIVILADVMSVIQYSNTEIKLGNSYMIQIKESATKRMNVILEDIKDYAIC